MLYHAHVNNIFVCILNNYFCSSHVADWLLFMTLLTIRIEEYKHAVLLQTLDRLIKYPFVFNWKLQIYILLFSVSDSDSIGLGQKNLAGLVTINGHIFFLVID